MKAQYQGMLLAHRHTNTHMHLSCRVPSVLWHPPPFGFTWLHVEFKVLVWN